MATSIITTNLKAHLNSLKDSYGLLYETSIADIITYLNQMRVTYKIEFVANPKHTGGLVNLFYENTFLVWEITFKPEEENNAFPT